MRVLIVLLGHYPQQHGSTVGRWQYDPKHDHYVLDGKELNPADFNAFMEGKDWERLIEQHGHRVRVKIVKHNSMKAARAKLPPPTTT